MTRTEAEKLFEENQNLAYYALKKYYPTFVNNEDIKQEALLGLWKACTSYDSSKSSFSTYACTCVLNQVRLYMRAQEKQPKTLSLSLPVGEDRSTLEELLEDPVPGIDDDHICLKQFLQGLPKRERLMVKMRLEGLNQKQIAKRFKISQPYCSKIWTAIRVNYIKMKEGKQ